MATAAAAAAAKKANEITFIWEGKDRAGKILKGEMRAGGATMVNATLRRQGITVTKVRKQRIGGGGKVSDKDVTLFGNAGFFIAHKDVPDDLVYEFTKLAYSDGAIRKVEMAFKGSNLNRLNPLEGNIGPLHPGALRYWKELGVTLPEPALK